MAKFTKQQPKSILEEVFPSPLAPCQPLEQVVSIAQTRCGGCAFFISKLDSNNPSDGFCHAYPPTPIPTGFRWAKTASNEFGCRLFQKRG